MWGGHPSMGPGPYQGNYPGQYPGQYGPGTMMGRPSCPTVHPPGPVGHHPGPMGIPPRTMVPHTCPMGPPPGSVGPPPCSMVPPPGSMVAPPAPKGPPPGSMGSPQAPRMGPPAYQNHQNADPYQYRGGLGQGGASGSPITHSSFSKEKTYQEPDSSTSSEGKIKEEMKDEEEGGEKMEDEEEEEYGYYSGPYCELCKLHLPSEHMLWRHMSGKKHLKAMKAMEAGRPLPVKVQERKETEEEVSSFERAFDSLTSDEPVVGLGFIVETYNDKEELLMCELCDSKCNTNNMVIHVLGLKHRMTYLKKCDPERYTRLKKQQKRSKLTEDTRQLCKEVEKKVGRGTPRYTGPQGRQRQQDTKPFTPRQLTAEERYHALEDLKRTLMRDLLLQGMDRKEADSMVEERLKLLVEYEKRGVPFDLAKERVLEEEDRWNLLLEFERQTLTFEEAEERIDYRMDLLKAYMFDSLSKEEARKKVLNEVVIRDFRREFQTMGVERQHAQRQVDKRLWMLERLHYQGFSQEEASIKVMKVERQFAALLAAPKYKESKQSELMAWKKAREDLKKFIQEFFSELGLSLALREQHIKLALDALDKHRKRRLSVHRARSKVLIEDLPIPEEDTDEDTDAQGEEKDDQLKSPQQEKDDQHKSPEEVKPSTSHSTATDVTKDDSAACVKDDNVQRVKAFMSKLHAVLVADKQSPGVNRDKQLKLFDDLSQQEMQTLLADMSKAQLDPYIAKSRFVDLFQQHERLRNSLFTFTKEQESHERLGLALKLFMQQFSLSIMDSASKDKSSLSEGRKDSKSRSKSADQHRRHSRRKRSTSKSRSKRRSRSSSSGCSPGHRGHRSSRKRSRSRSYSPVSDSSRSRRDRYQSSRKKGRSRSRSHSFDSSPGRRYRRHHFRSSEHKSRSRSPWSRHKGGKKRSKSRSPSKGKGH